MDNIKEYLIAGLLGMIIGTVMTLYVIYGGGSGGTTVSPEVKPANEITGIINRLENIQQTITRIETKVNNVSQGGLININRNPKANQPADGGQKPPDK